MEASASPLVVPRLFTAADPRALEARLLDELDTPASADPFARTFIVAPTRRLLDHLSSLLTARRGALAGVHFLHHRSLAAHLLAEAGGAEPASASAPLLELLLLARLQRMELPLARYVAQQPAALGPLLSTLRDLRDSGVDGNAARRVHASTRAKETLEIFATFEELLEVLWSEGASDGAGLARAAIAASAQRPPECARLIHYGAYDLIGVHRELVATLARRVPTTFFVAAPDGSARPREFAATFGVAADASHALASPAASPRRTSLVSCAGPREEIRLAVRTLLGWATTDRVPFADLAILTRSPGSHGRALRAEAALQELVPDTSFLSPLAMSPAALALRVVLASISDGVPVRDEPADAAATRQAFVAAAAKDPTAALAALTSWAERNGDAALLAEVIDARAEVARHLASMAPLSPSPLSPAVLARYVVRRLDEAHLRPDRERVGPVRVLDFHQARALPFARAVLVGANDRLLPRRAADDFFLPDADRRALREATGAAVPLRSAARTRADEELLFDAICAAVHDERVVTFARADADDRELAPSPFLRRLGLDARRPDALIPRSPREENRKLLERTGLLSRQEAIVQASALGGGAPQELAPALGFDDALCARGFARIATIDSFESRDLRFDGGGIAVSAKASWSPSELQQLGRCPLQYFFERELGLCAPEEPADGELSARELGTLLHATLHRLYRQLLPPGRPVVAAELCLQAQRRLPVVLDEAAAEIAAPSRVAPRLWALRREQIARDLLEFVAADLQRLEANGLCAGEFETPQAVTLEVGSRKLPLSFRIDRILLDGEGGEWIGDYKSSGASELEKSSSPLEVIRGQSLQLPLYRLARMQHGRPVAALEFLSLRRPKLHQDERFFPFKLGALAKRDAELTDTLAALLELRDAGSFPLVSDARSRFSRCGRCDFQRACRHAHAPTCERVEEAAVHARFYGLAAKEARGAAGKKP